MNDDPILAELRAPRDRLGARFGYDVDSIFRHIKKEEAKSGLRYIECPPRKLTPAEDDPGERGPRDDGTAVSGPRGSEKQRSGMDGGSRTAPAIDRGGRNDLVGRRRP